MRNCYKPKNTAMEAPVWSAGMYIRLSREDGDKEESDSVRHQRMMLEDFVKSLDRVNLYDTYIDDGFTGTHFDRPAFQRMIADLKDHKINCILVKDLSRFGRDYIGVGEYLEKIFPWYGTRFIAINDGVDSEKKTNMDITPFKAVMNDMYAKDISQKVKSVKRTKALRGLFTGGFAPFGYKKDPQNGSRLMMDEETAWVVKKIFELRIAGMSNRAIAGYLNEQKIFSPAEVKKEKGETWKNAGHQLNKQLWGTTTIHRILNNEVYLGHMEQNKSMKVSYKIKKKKDLQKADHIIVQNTHEPIIGPESWEKVQELLGKPTTRHFSNEIKNKYSGFVRCGDCGRAMASKSAYSGSGKWTNKEKKLLYYVCGAYRNNGVHTCTSKSIRADVLDKILLDDIQKEVQLALTADEIAEIVNRKESSLQIRKNINGQLHKLEERQEQVRKLKKGAYEDYKLGELARQDYLTYKADYEAEENELRRKIDALTGEKNGEEQKMDSHTTWLMRFKKYANIDEMNRDVIVDLVDRVEFYDNKLIKIVYRYRSEFAAVPEKLGVPANGPNASANWLPGQPVVVPAPTVYQELKERLQNTQGYSCMDWYLCMKPGAEGSLPESENSGAVEPAANEKKE